MVASLFIIQPASAEPIYRQIVEQLRRLIASGQLATGELLPSVRGMAGFHAVNPMTVSRAYSLAENEGLLERVRGKGMAVAAGQRTAHSQAQRLALLEPQMLALARQAQELELPTEPVLRRRSRDARTGLGKLLGKR
ncbi:GntR family transcriptional regulator [Frateuria sp. GZRR33]|uniref:GntR family transcriptional regulator n=1 Tax=Frateuria sp. GZRR33 TaxID=3351535 RepID=UPI003EDC02A8